MTSEKSYEQEVNMNDLFFPELLRCLRKQGITTGPVENNRLPVLMDGQTAMWVESQGCIVLTIEAVGDPKASQIYKTVNHFCSPIHEFTEAMTKAPVLEVSGLHDEFRLLAEYNGVVLAARKLAGDWGYQFVTWRRSLDRASLDHGNYYDNDYEGAKLDFACRSGLVQECLQFTNEQLAEIYRCVHETLESGYPITAERERMLMDVCAQIQWGVADLDSRVMRSNEKELAAAQRRPECDGERPESIEIFWQDLTKAKQSEILLALGENGNYDVFPIATIEVPPEDRTSTRQEQQHTTEG